MTYRQTQAKELMQAEGRPQIVAKRMGVSVRAVQYLLARAGSRYPVGRPKSRLGLQRISLAATGLM